MESPWKTIRRNSHAINVITMINNHDDNNNNNNNIQLLVIDTDHDQK